MTKKGAQWKRVQAMSLSDRSRKLYRQYMQKAQEASAIAHKLKDAVTSEWNDKYPDGINGQVCAFNAMNGVLQYVMKNKKRPKATTKKAFDEASGDDVFGSPPTGPLEMSKSFGASEGTNEEATTQNVRPRRLFLTRPGQKA